MEIWEKYLIWEKYFFTARLHARPWIGTVLSCFAQVNCFDQSFMCFRGGSHEPPTVLHSGCTILHIPSLFLFALCHAEIMLT